MVCHPAGFRRLAAPNVDHVPAAFVFVRYGEGFHGHGDSVHFRQDIEWQSKRGKKGKQKHSIQGE